MDFLGLPPGVELATRVYVRRPGDEYVEIPGIQSFAREEQTPNGEITFIVAAEESAALDSLLDDGESAVDVKMAFSIGLQMKFSGQIESVGSNSVCIALSTPITTDALDSADSAIH